MTDKSKKDAGKCPVTGGANTGGRGSSLKSPRPVSLLPSGGVG